MLCIQYYTIFCVKNVGDGKNKKSSRRSYVKKIQDGCLGQSWSQATIYY